jgi:glycine oxidase
MTAQVVGCLGAWAGAVRKDSFFYEPIEPVRGQVSIYARKKPLRILLHTVDGGYLIPWTNGRILAGSTVERAGFTPQVTIPGQKKIHQYAERVLPELAKLRPVQKWAGLRPRSLMRIPRIGKTRISGYYVANGYYRCGILIGLYAGELLVQSMELGKSLPVLRPFAPT